MNTFTPNDLMLYLAQELPNEQAKELQKELCFDEHLFATYQNLLDSIHEVDNFILEPSFGFLNNLKSRIESIDLALA